MAAGDDRAIVTGRYALHRRIASGGMASVYYGRVFGAEGFSRVVAIKRLHPQYATDSLFRAALIDEARLVSRIRHPNVVPVLDVVSDGDELLVVMEYVHGEKLSTLLRLCRERRDKVPLPVVTGLVSDTLRGLHAAHEATSPKGELLGIVHRDVSPQNVLVSADGSALVTDFGIAKAVGRSQTTNEGQIKGKLAYMAHEQLSGGAVTRRTDVAAAAIVLWEALTLRRLFGGDSEGEVYAKLMQHAVGPPSQFAAEVPRELDALVLRGLDKNPERRFATAQDMAEELERIVPPAPRSETARWLRSVAGQILEERARDIEAVEQLDVDVPIPSSPAALPPAEPAALAASGDLSKGTWHLASRSRSRKPLLGLAALALAALGLAVWFFVLRQRTDEPTIEAVAPAEPAVPAVAAPVTPSAEPPALPPPSAAPAPSASAKRPAGAPKPRVARPATTKPSAGCRVLGADGIWRIRPGCL